MQAIRLCGAKTRNGTPCLRAPMMNGRCSKHGGKSLAGFAHPRYRHGRYSKYSFERGEDRWRRQNVAVARDLQRAFDKLPDGTEVTVRLAARLLREVNEAHRRRGWFVS